MTISAAIHSMRLRTLPLSLAGVVLGTLLACSNLPGCANALTITFLMLTTIALQVLTNLCNELGDFLSGTDTPDRQGPQYSLAEGKITIPEFKRMIVGTAILCAISGTILIWSAFGSFWRWQSILLLLAGAAAIWAAIRYMLGKGNYGSKGLGDISVFVFFGLVSVMGSYFVMAQTLSWTLLLPAISIGLFSVGVLNVNNIRDMETDRGKRMTIPLRIGEKKAKIYQTVLIYGGLIVSILYSGVEGFWFRFTYLAFLPLIFHVSAVYKNSGKALDKQLPLLVIYTFIFAVCMGLDRLLFHI